jgi:class 3 adenylate cyclase
LHINIKEFLHAKAAAVGYRLYNFTGDGWILLFPGKVNGQRLIIFLEELCKRYADLYAKNIKPVLETNPEVIGVTFGMDRGQLIKIHMNGRDEFVGRPINVACRLQSAIKDKDKNPGNKILISKHLFESIKTDLKTNRFGEVKRKLRNIAGGRDISCMKADILKT